MVILTLPDDVVPASMLVDRVSYISLGVGVYQNYLKPFVVATGLLDDMTACCPLWRPLICTLCPVADRPTAPSLVRGRLEEERNIGISRSSNRSSGLNHWERHLVVVEIAPSAT